MSALITMGGSRKNLVDPAIGSIVIHSPDPDRWIFDLDQKIKARTKIG